MNLVVMPVVAGPVMTRAAIDSVLAQDIPGGVTLMVIDNGSRDCGPVLRSYGRRITLVSYSSQHSLNKVWNDAIDLAFDSLHLDCVLVVNNDVVLAPHTFRLLAADGGGFVTGVGTSDLTSISKADPASKRPHPDFSCFLIRAEVWRRVGKFEETYWAYASDNSYHLRMHRAGVDAHCISVPFYHIASGTIKHADNSTRDMLQKRADADRQTFRMQYGFDPGSDAYNQEFTR